MNDRFKFRAWDKEKEMMNFCLSLFFQKHGNAMFKIIMDLTEYDLGSVDQETQRHILMQCTGLKDKNGKLIYEGDVVIDDKMGVSEVRYLNASYVVYKGAHFVIGEKRAINSEVIGNIWENPELIETL